MVPGMSDVSSQMAQKLWSHCHVLRDDGLSYQDYLDRAAHLSAVREDGEEGEADNMPPSTRQGQPEAASKGLR